MSKQKLPLREKPVTLRPRVVVRGGKFWTEYYGPLVKGECGKASPSFEAAIAYANEIAKRHAPRIKAARNKAAA